MIRVTIDKIVLDGVTVPPAERTDLRESIARELATLMGSAATIPGQASGIAVPVVDGGTMANEGRLASRIARSVHGALGVGARKSTAPKERAGGAAR